MELQSHAAKEMQLYAISLNDHAAPSFCSFEKLYIGSLDEISLFIDRLEKTGHYLDTVAAFRGFMKGDKEAEHPVAYHMTKLLIPVNLVCADERTLEARKWDHINTWGFPYHMRFDEARISQIIVDKQGTLIRLIRGWFKNLSYEDGAGGWIRPDDGFWGHPGMIDVQYNPDGSITLNNLLYVAEDSASDDKATFVAEFSKKPIVLDSICEEIFGDG